MVRIPNSAAQDIFNQSLMSLFRHFIELACHSADQDQIFEQNIQFE